MRGYWWDGFSLLSEKKKKNENNIGIVFVTDRPYALNKIMYYLFIYYYFYYY